jgi:hypothetical protein
MAARAAARKANAEPGAGDAMARAAPDSTSARTPSKSANKRKQNGFHGLSFIFRNQAFSIGCKRKIHKIEFSSQVVGKTSQVSSP